MKPGNAAEAAGNTSEHIYFIIMDARKASAFRRKQTPFCANK